LCENNLFDGLKNVDLFRRLLSEDGETSLATILLLKYILISVRSRVVVVAVAVAVALVVAVVLALLRR
jgi:hypothetical protein